MLLTTLEIVPHGQWEDRYPIKKIYIVNIGGNPHKADYHVWFDQDPTDKSIERPKPDLHIKKYKRDKGATELLRQILNSWYTKQNKEKKHAKSRAVKTSPIIA